jgi:hypothetical protein
MSIDNRNTLSLCGTDETGARYTVTAAISNTNIYESKKYAKITGVIETAHIGFIRHSRSKGDNDKSGPDPEGYI